MTRAKHTSILFTFLILAVFVTDAWAMYDAPVGRWMQRDPAEDGRNLYLAMGDAPVSTTDPQGLETKWEKFKRLAELAQKAKDQFETWESRAEAAKELADAAKEASRDGLTDEQAIETVTTLASLVDKSPGGKAIEAAAAAGLAGANINNKRNACAWCLITEAKVENYPRGAKPPAGYLYIVWGDDYVRWAVGTQEHFLVCWDMLGDGCIHAMPVDYSQYYDCSSMEVVHHGPKK